MALKDKQKVTKNQHLWQSMWHALCGLGTAVKLERNMRWHVLAAVLVIVLGWWLGLTLNQWLWIGLAIFLVIQSEVFNTVIEQVVDLLTAHHYVLAAKYAKDMAAAAVLLAALFAFCVGLLIFIPKILGLLP
ncbi:diacylglycerol kinase [Loigolactobacillus rennini DSM 20253]|uniref:Diacylglycerol kinase n=2 Tax=Loigolactobacillus rennini TaxID=238013 RepID=A0A0R2D8Q4_9LACO|nr:diacylglycerol kinase family protein [Loigolactobacillus rennini]KRM96700.1 diacylglycerol kinase [Loigolactobacillus rennini DSM 20253]